MLATLAVATGHRIDQVMALGYELLVSSILFLGLVQASAPTRPCRPSGFRPCFGTRHSLFTPLYGALLVMTLLVQSTVYVLHVEHCTPYSILRTEYRPDKVGERLVRA